MAERHVVHNAASSGSGVAHEDLFCKMHTKYMSCRSSQMPHDSAATDLESLHLFPTVWSQSFVALTPEGRP
jgi:hypothetical protein